MLLAYIAFCLGGLVIVIWAFSNGDSNRYVTRQRDSPVFSPVFPISCFFLKELRSLTLPPSLILNMCLAAFSMGLTGLAPPVVLMVMISISFGQILFSTTLWALSVSTAAQQASHGT